MHITTTLHSFFVDSLLLTLQIWNMDSHECVETLQCAHSDRVRVLLGANRLLFSGSYDKTIKVCVVFVSLIILFKACVLISFFRYGDVSLFVFLI